MTAKIISVFLAGWMALIFSAGAQDNQLTDAQIQDLAKGLHYQQGQIKIQDSLATLDVPTNFYYLNAQDAKTVLVKLWGNPPSQVEDTLGLLMPSNVTPLDPACWAVIISYANDGYVKDDDASKINYDDLLKKMQAGTRENNKARTDKGYPAMELVGWATPPHYDAATHKLYWAKELKIEGASEDTLNYDIRILGRHGVLVLTAVAGMTQLPEIEKQTPGILSMVNFDQGNRYADFDPKVDKVATYGIAALVAGGIAAKLGLFKLIWVFILAAKKFIIIGLAAIAAWFKKLFGRQKTPPPTA
ncbi:MAG TPA: DUF2167 domain-containing protein [Pseudomonadales bacterium]|nr:DUF2167 domain-containing protein [Pseudomonadales bacterium]